MGKMFLLFVCMTNLSLNPVKLFAWVMTRNSWLIDSWPVLQKRKIFLFLLAYFVILSVLLSVKNNFAEIN